LWDERDQCLYWVDIRQPALRRYAPDSGRIDTWAMPDLVGCIALTDEGRLLVALPQFIALFDPASGSLEAFARSPAAVPGHRFNDGRCDRQGRFWVGSMHNLTRAPEGVLYRLEGRGELQAVRSGICIPNSLAFSPDGRTMYFADSLRYELYAHAYDPEHGHMGAGRLFAATVPPGFPDGSTVDAEGFLWNAEFDSGRLVRYAPDGRMARTIALPVARPTCCAFGGPGLDTLFVTTTSQKMTPAEREAQPLAGALLALDVGVRGLPEPRFDMARKTTDPIHVTEATPL
jgi:sugar lactone lactonase YvrE